MNNLVWIIFIILDSHPLSLPIKNVEFTTKYKCEQHIHKQKKYWANHKTGEPVKEKYAYCQQVIK